MKKLKYFTLILFIIIGFFNITAQNSLNLFNFFSKDDIQQVLNVNSKIVARMYLKNNAVNENTDLKIDVPRSIYANEDYSIYEMITDEKAFIPYKLDENSKLKFYNVLISFSKLKGMKYFSMKSEEIQVLIEDCYRIESPEKRAVIKDSYYTKIEPKIVNYFVQKDNIFGKLAFKSILYNEGNNFILINSCIDPISTYMLKVCNSDEYKVITYFIYNEKLQGFFYYTVNVMRIRVDFVLKKNNILTLYPTTFSTRLRAGTVHLVKLLGIDWDDKIKPWKKKKLKKGLYKNY